MEEKERQLFSRYRMIDMRIDRDVHILYVKLKYVHFGTRINVI